MIVHNCEQRSKEWYEARLGLPTASCFDRIVTSTGRASSSKAKDRYMHELIAELVLGHETIDYTSVAMDNGIETEPRGIAEYENEFSCTVTPVGFITNDDATVGCSPDGLVESKEGLEGPGGIELKCGLAHTHVGNLLDSDAFRKKHWQQVQGAMWVTGRAWWNLVSYFPSMKLATVLCYRDEDTRTRSSC